METTERIRVCVLADKIYRDPEYAKRIKVKDTSHFKKTEKKKSEKKVVVA